MPKSRDTCEGVAFELDVAHFADRPLGDLINHFSIVQIAALDELAIREGSSLFRILLQDLLAALAIELGVELRGGPNVGDVLQILRLYVLGAHKSDFLNHDGHFAHGEKYLGVIAAIRLKPSGDVAELTRFVQRTDIIIDDGEVVLLAGLCV